MISGERLARCVICLQTSGVALGYILAVAAVDVFYAHKHIADAGMAFGYAFCLLQVGIIVSLVLCSVVIKFSRKRSEARALRLRPLILEKAAAYLAGTGGMTELAEAGKRNPEALERYLGEMLARVRGDARTRLSELAVALGLVERWVGQYRSRVRGRRRAAIARLALIDHPGGIATLVGALSDEDVEIKMEASRALIQSHGAAERRTVFHRTIRESLLVRAILVEDLRPHARELCEAALPEELAETDPQTVRIALDVVLAWGKTMPIEGVCPLLEHEDAGVRARAFAVAAQLPQAAELEAEMRRGLEDQDESVRAAAAEAAGRLHFTALAADLERCLERGGAEATVAAAYALARIGQPGWKMLERQVHRSRSAAARASLEALEQARSGRLALGSL